MDRVFKNADFHHNVCKKANKHISKSLNVKYKTLTYVSELEDPSDWLAVTIK